MLQESSLNLKKFPVYYKKVARKNKKVTEK